MNTTKARPAARRRAGSSSNSSLAVLDRLAVLDVDRADDALDLGLDLVHQLHRLEDAERLARRDRVALLDERRRARLRTRGRTSPTIGASTRIDAVGRRSSRRAEAASVRGSLGAAAARRDARRLLASGARVTPHPSSSTVISPTPVSWTIRTTSRIRSARAWSTPPLRAASSPLDAVADRAQERLGLLAEQRQQQQLLLARGEAFCLVAERRRGRPARPARRRRPATSATARCTVASIWPGGVPKRPCEQVAQLVDDGLVAARREHVDERLRAEDLADRRGERRRAGLARMTRELVEHLVEPVAGAVRAQVRVERRDEPGRQLVLRGADGDSRRERRHRLVADVLVDDRPRRCQSVSTSTPRVDAEPGERLGERLAGDAVER